MVQETKAGARDAGATEREILAAAVRLIRDRGYHGMTFRALAAEVGLQMASLYYYFPSKQALLLHIMTRTMHDLTATVEDSCAGIEDPIECLEAAIRGHILFHARWRMEAFVADSELRALEPKNRQSVMQLRDNYERLFAELLQAAVEAGTVRPVDVKLTVYSVMAMCTGVALWYRPEGRLSLEEIADAYCSLVLDGILDREEVMQPRDRRTGQC